MPRHLTLVPLMLLLLAVAGCSNPPLQPVNLNSYYNDMNTGGVQGSLLGKNGLSVDLFKSHSNDSKGGALGVNAFLWRGTLDTLSFMPLVSADPFGGVIITDWYSPPGVTNERFKATAYIMGRELRADGVRVSVFHQVQQNGQWVDAPVSPSTVDELENKILARARQLRSESGAG